MKLHYMRETMMNKKILIHMSFHVHEFMDEYLHPAQISAWFRTNLIWTGKQWKCF